MITIRTYSELFKSYYDPEDCVMLVNALQAYRYLSHGAKLVDLMCGDHDRLVFVFRKCDTKELYKKWCDYALN